MFKGAPHGSLRDGKAAGQGAHHLRFGILIFCPYFLKFPNDGVPLQMGRGDQVLVNQKSDELVGGLFDLVSGAKRFKTGLQVFLKLVQNIFSGRLFHTINL